MQKGVREKPLRDVPRFIAPLRPKMVSSLPEDRSKWLFEPKLDGYRVIAGGHANLYSMDSKIYNQEFPAIHDAVSGARFEARRTEAKVNSEIEAELAFNRPASERLSIMKGTCHPRHLR